MKLARKRRTFYIDNKNKNGNATTCAFKRQAKWLAPWSWHTEGSDADGGSEVAPLCRDHVITRWKCCNCIMGTVACRSTI